MVARQGHLPAVVVGLLACAPQTTTTMSEKLLTRAEVANLLAISLRSVDRLRARGILPAVKLLSTVRFREEDVRKLIAPRQGANR